MVGEQAKIETIPKPVKREGNVPAIASETLFGHRQELIIQHHEMTYRLRITKAGKLILTK